MPNGLQQKPKTPGSVQSDRGPAGWTRLVGFIREVCLELKPPKTKWPTWREAWRLTTVVLGVILVVAIYIGSVDFVLTTITKKLNLIK